MKTRNILSIDIYVKTQPRLVNIPITITILSKKCIRVKKVRKILKLINEK